MSQAQTKPRRALRRALGLTAIIAVTYGFAVLVARPHVPDPTTNPYVGQRGGSLAKTAGLQIRARRGDELLNVAPQTVLRAGDQLVFDVRGEHACFLEVRLRDGAGAPQTIFPSGRSTTPEVTPGERLPAAHLVTAGGGKLVVTALFSARPLPVGAPPASDTLVTTAVVEKE